MVVGLWSAYQNPDVDVSFSLVDAGTITNVIKAVKKEGTAAP